MGRANTKAWRRLPLVERKAILAHEKLLRDQPCVVRGTRNDLSLHHCHGGSMKNIGVHVGTGQKSSDWLQIPIEMKIHVGPQGIDGGLGVLTWEELHGSQVEHLKTISRRVGYSVFKKAGVYGVEL